MIEVNGKQINEDDDPGIHSKILGVCSKDEGRISMIGHYLNCYGLWGLNYDKNRLLESVTFYSPDGKIEGCYGDNNLKVIVAKGVTNIWKRTNYPKSNTSKRKWKFW